MIPAEERLGRLGLVVPGVLVGLLLVVDDCDDGRGARFGLDRLGEGRVAIGFALRPLPVDVDLRQQQAACLGLDLEGRLAAGLGLPDQGVALDSVLVDLEQILGTRGP